jgi:hypothetical protein
MYAILYAFFSPLLKRLLRAIVFFCSIFMTKPPKADVAFVAQVTVPVL